MKGSKPGSNRRELTAMGWILSLGGLLLAVLTYFLLGIGEFFAGLDGTLGLSEMIWTVIGGVIWLFVVMAILTPIVAKVGIKQ